jgi:hypothetical protein
VKLLQPAPSTWLVFPHKQRPLRAGGRQAPQLKTVSPAKAGPNFNHAPRPSPAKAGAQFLRAWHRRPRAGGHPAALSTPALPPPATLLIFLHPSYQPAITSLTLGASSVVAMVSRDLLHSHQRTKKLQYRRESTAKKPRKRPWILEFKIELTWISAGSVHTQVSRELSRCDDREAAHKFKPLHPRHFPRLNAAKRPPINEFDIA